MNTAETQLKGLMLRDKQFLKELYEGSSAELKKKTLTFASDVKLNTLIKFLHFLTNGHICMKKDNFEQIPTKNLKYLNTHFLLCVLLFFLKNFCYGTYYFSCVF